MISPQLSFNRFPVLKSIGVFILTKKAHCKADIRIVRPPKDLG